MILTFRYRVKSLTGLLNKQARAVNFVFNFCNDTQKSALKWGKKWPSSYDLMKLTAGTSKDLGLHCGTIEQTCAQYVGSRQQRRGICRTELSAQDAALRAALQPFEPPK